MAETKQKYTAITPPAFTSANSLANSTTCKSAALDNTTSLYVDIIGSLSFKTAAGTLGTTPVLYLYFAASPDGTNYTGNITPGDASYTFPAVNNFKLLLTINVAASNTADVSDEFSLATAFGGSVPSKGVFILTDASGLALAAAGNALNLTGVTYTTA